MISQLVSRSSRPLPRRADRARLAARRRSVFMLEGLETRQVLSTFTWTGAAGTNWLDLDNWRVGKQTATELPGADDDVVFDAGAINATLTADTAVKSIAIKSGYGGTISINASLTQTDGFSVVGGTVKLGKGQTLTSGGNFTIWGAGSFETGLNSTVVFTTSPNSESGVVNASGVDFQNVEVRYGGGDLDVKGGPNVKGALTLTSYGTISGNINVSGSVITNAAWNDAAASSGKITFVGAGNQILRGTGGDGALPKIVVNKDAGALTISGDISPRDWTQTNGNLSARNSTTTFRRGSTVDTGAASLGNVTIAMGEGTLQVDQLNVGGKLSIESAKEIKWVSGATARAINVAGDLVSADPDVGGNAVITMTGGTSASLIGGAVGDFPDGGIVINKVGLNVTVDVQKPLDGPLVIQNANAINSAKLEGGGLGVLTVGRNVTTHAPVSGTGTIVFAGESYQRVRAMSPNAGLPSVRFDKDYSPEGTSGVNIETTNPLSVAGSWIVADTNAGPINASGATIRFTRPTAYYSTIDMGGATTFYNLEFDTGHSKGVSIVGEVNVRHDLTIRSLGFIRDGVVNVHGDLTTSADNPDVKGHVVTGAGAGIAMVGKGTQTITAEGEWARIPALTISKPKSSKLNIAGGKLGVTGSWIVADENAGSIIVDPTSAVKFFATATVNTGKTVDPIPGARTMEFNDVEIALPNNDIIVRENMVVGGKLTIHQLRFIHGGAVTAKGDVTTYASTIGYTGGSIKFAGKGEQTLTAAAENAKLPSILIDKNGGSLTLAPLDAAGGSHIIGVSGSWTVAGTNRADIEAAGSTVKFTTTGVVDTGDVNNADPKSKTMAFGNVIIDTDNDQVQRDLTVANMVVGGNLTINRVNRINKSKNAGASGVIELAGNLSSNNTSLGGGAIIILNGSGVQTITASVDGAVVPGLEFKKTAGSVTVTPGRKTLGVNGGWDASANTGPITTTGTTIRFVGNAGHYATRTINTGGGGGFHNVEINLLPSNALNVEGALKIGGHLTINEVGAINAALGAITVGGNLVSKIPGKGPVIGGNADITMVAGDDPSAQVKFIGGAFPMGGIIIDKGPKGSVRASVSYLAAPLHLKSLGSLTGTLEVTNDVRTSSKALYGNADFKRVLFFKGGAHQTLTADVHKDGTVSSIPGVEIDKSGGSLTIGSRSADGVVYSTIVVTGGWIVSDNNKATFDVGEGPTGSTIQFGIKGGDLTSPTIDTGRARTEGAPKAVKGMRFNNVVLNVKGDVTIGKMVVDGTLTLNRGNSVNGGDIDAYGDVVAGATKGMTGGSRIRFLGSNDQTLAPTESGRLMPGVIINKTGGELTISGEIDVLGNWTYIGGGEDVDAAGSTIRFVGGREISSGSMVFNHVDLANGSKREVTIVDTMIVGGDLTISVVETLEGGVIEARGDVTTNDKDVHGDATILFAGSNDQRFKAGINNGQVPNVEIRKEGGLLAIGNAPDDDVSNNIAVTGNWTYTGGGADVDAAGSRIRFVNGVKEINSGLMVFGDVDLANGDANSVTIGGDAMIVGGKLILVKFASLDGVIEARGDVTTNDKDIKGDGVIRFVGSAPQTLKAGVAKAQLPNVEIRKTGFGSLTIDDSNPIHVTGNWSYTGLGFNVDAADSTIVFVGAAPKIDSGLMVFGDVDLDGGNGSVVTVNGGAMIVGGELTITRIGSLNGTVAALGNVTTNDATVGGTGTIFFTGGGNQTFKAGVANGQVPNVRILKTGGKLTIGEKVGDAPARPISVSGNWSYFGLGRDVDATSQQSTIKFVGGNKTIRPGLMVFYNVDFTDKKVNEVEILAPFTNRAGTLRHAGWAKVGNKLTKGSLKQV